MSLISEQDIEEGVIVRYLPPQPLLIVGMAPGESRRFAIDVKVCDLSHPDHLEHTGKLELTYSYLPGGRARRQQFGSADRWSYRGKVWLADVEDTQYHFVTPDAGIVASIDKEDISALLVYQEHSKTGLVLQEGP